MRRSSINPAPGSTNTGSRGVGEHYRRKGFEVTFEYKIGDGKSVDLVAEKDGKRIAIEIEAGKSDSLYNVRKDLEARFDEVLLVFLSDKAKSEAEFQFSSISLSGKDRVRIIQASAFL